MHPFRCLLVAAAIAVAPLTASAQSDSVKVGGVRIENPFARPSAGTAGAGAAYMTIRGGAAGDKLIAASAVAVAGKAELHDHIHEGNVMRMRKVEAIDVPAQGTVELKPGGLHVMLMSLKKPLKTGDGFDLVLTFEKAGAVTVKVPVLTMGAGMNQGMRHDSSKHGMPKH